MRFSSGSRVEVLIKKKVPSGVWRLAEVMSDNVDSYTVRFCRRRPGVSKEVIEKVPVEDVRPCPPPVVDPLNWIVGDIVEVLDDGYWKGARIEDVLGDGFYYVHLIGSIDEFKVEKSSIRAKQLWKDNKWVVSGKDSGEGMMSKMLKKTHIRKEGDSNFLPKMESVVQSKGLKRSSPDSSSPGEVVEENVEKRRAVVQDVLNVISPDSYSFVGKVDSCAYMRENQGKDNEQTFTQKTSKFNNANSRNHDVTEFLGRTLESDDCVSTVSSVGSCSFFYANLDRLSSHSSAGCRQNNDSLCSDAESFEHHGVEERMTVAQSKEEYAQRIHEIELNTYRSALESLYACGPLSWEQEALLTNLRISLFVSNDEHLSELRRLKSVGGLHLCCH